MSLSLLNTWAMVLAAVAGLLAGRLAVRAAPALVSFGVVLVTAGVLLAVPDWSGWGDELLDVALLATLLPWLIGRVWRQSRELVWAGAPVVGEAGDGRAAVELVQRHRPDVALLDVRMPGTDGLQATAEIRRTMPSTAVIVLTTFGQDDYILAALGGGASGFLVKSGEPEELPAAVRAVADGAAYLSLRVAAKVIATWPRRGWIGGRWRGRGWRR
ncbi:response regulator [Flindersiella endophytica]